MFLNFLYEHNSATVKYLAQYFSVTKETIRSDLRILAQQGYIQRCHGGAISKRWKVTHGAGEFSGAR